MYSCSHHPDVAISTAAGKVDEYFTFARAIILSTIQLERLLARSALHNTIT